MSDPGRSLSLAESRSITCPGMSVNTPTISALSVATKRPATHLTRRCAPNRRLAAGLSSPPGGVTRASSPGAIVLRSLREEQPCSGLLAPTDDQRDRVTAPLDGAGTRALADHAADSPRASAAHASDGTAALPDLPLRGREPQPDHSRHDPEDCRRWGRWRWRRRRRWRRGRRWRRRRRWRRWRRRRRWRWRRWGRVGRDVQRPAGDRALVYRCVVDEVQAPGAVCQQTVEDRQVDVPRGNRRRGGEDVGPRLGVGRP